MACVTSPVRSMSYKTLMIHHFPKKTHLVRKEYFAKYNFSMAIIWTYNKVYVSKFELSKVFNGFILNHKQM